MATVEIQTTDFIYKTTDYDKFKTIKGNRAINKKNYRKLIESVRQKQLRIPIVVNEKMEIIDGQHRFEAWKEEGLPIFYIINEGYGLEDVKRANVVSSNWNNQDFLQAFVKDGREVYQEFYEIIKKYRVHITDLIELFSRYQDRSGIYLMDDFKTGNFTLEGKEQAINFLESLELFATDFKECKTSKFFRAFLRLYHNPDYSHEQMIRQFNTQGYKLKKQNTIADYLSILTRDIYSFKLSNKNQILYDRETNRFYN